MDDKLDILKASVPFATLTGVVVGALLNSKLGRKEKIRDHLFSYKVKSYSVMAECVIGIKRDMSNVIRDIRIKRKEESKTINDIYKDFIKVSNEQTLFLSDRTKDDLLELEDDIFETSTLEIERFVYPDKISDNEMIDACKKVKLGCEIFINKIQDELGLNLINKRKPANLKTWRKSR